MDGENHGSKPYFLIDDLGGTIIPIFGLTPIWQSFQGALTGKGSALAMGEICEGQTY